MLFVFCRFKGTTVTDHRSNDTSSQRVMETYSSYHTSLVAPNKLSLFSSSGGLYLLIVFIVNIFIKTVNTWCNSCDQKLSKVDCNRIQVIIQSARVLLQPQFELTEDIK